MTIDAYIRKNKRKKKRSDFHHKKLSKNEFKPGVTRRKKIVKRKNQ